MSREYQAELERTYAETFHIVWRDELPAESACPTIRELTDDEFAFKQSLRRFASYLEATIEQTPPSIWVKYHARMLCIAFAFGSLHDLRIDASASNVGLYQPEDGSFRLVLERPNPATADHSRCMADLCRDLFDRHLSLLLESIHRVSGLPMNILWESAFVYIDFFYKDWTQNRPELAERLKQDYELVLRVAPSLKLSGRLIDHPTLSGQQLRIRQTCCLRYGLPDGRRCTTCPSISDRERVELLQRKG